MNVVGIIVEYNPFHNGHLYHINKTKEILNPDLLVAVMSGNFTQRGDIAIIDKFSRAKIALKHGVDLVIELPYPYATSSADLFAQGAIKLLNAIGARAIVFGSERNNEKELLEIAQLIDSDSFQSIIRSYIKEGHAYPKASDLAMKQFLPHIVSLDTNDTLGVQYIRAIQKINPKITFHTIQRIGSHYHDDEFKHESISSATAIRKAIKEKKDISPFVPIETINALNEETKDWEDFYPFLKYQIINLGEKLNCIHDMTEGLDRRIFNYNFQSNHFSSFLHQLTSRRHTESKIRRVLLHILNHFTKEDFYNHRDYIRILGFKKEKSPLIKQAIKNSAYPVITNIKKEYQSLLAVELRVDHIYHLNDFSRVRKIPIWHEND